MSMRLLRLLIAFVAVTTLLAAGVSRPSLFSSGQRTEETEEKETKDTAKKLDEELSLRHHRVRVPKPLARSAMPFVVVAVPRTIAEGVVPAAPPDLPRRLL